MSNTQTCNYSRHKKWTTGQEKDMANDLDSCSWTLQQIAAPCYLKHFGSGAASATAILNAWSVGNQRLRVAAAISNSPRYSQFGRMHLYLAPKQFRLSQKTGFLNNARESFVENAKYYHVDRICGVELADEGFRSAEVLISFASKYCI